MSTRSPTLAELLTTLREGIFRDLHVSCTARILSYDAGTHEVSVQPIPADTIENENGELVPLPLPAIVGVPWATLEAGGFHVHVTPVAGDYCTLIFTDRSIDAFLASGTESAPSDLRRHALSDAIAYPLYGKQRPSGLPACVSLGGNTGSDDFVALASKVKAALDALVTWAGSHTHTGVQTGGGSSGTAVPPSVTTNVASATVNVRG